MTEWISDYPQGTYDKKYYYMTAVAYPGFCFGGGESVKQQGKNFFFMAIYLIF